MASSQQCLRLKMLPPKCDSKQIPWLSKYLERSIICSSPEDRLGAQMRAPQRLPCEEKGSQHYLITTEIMRQTNPQAEYIPPSISGRAKQPILTSTASQPSDTATVLISEEVVFISCLSPLNLRVENSGTL